MSDNNIRQELVRIILTLEKYVLNDGQLMSVYNKNGGDFKRSLTAYLSEAQKKKYNNLSNLEKNELKQLLRKAFANHFEKPLLLPKNRRDFVKNYNRRST